MEEILKFLERYKIEMPEDKEEFAWKLADKSKGTTILRQLAGMFGHAQSLCP